MEETWALGPFTLPADPKRLSSRPVKLGISVPLSFRREFSARIQRFSRVTQVAGNDFSCGKLLSVTSLLLQDASVLLGGGEVALVRAKDRFSGWQLIDAERVVA